MRPAPPPPPHQVWDLEAQHCCQTLAGHKGEVWSLDVDPAETRLVTGASPAWQCLAAPRGPRSAAGAALPISTHAHKNTQNPPSHPNSH